MTKAEYIERYGLERYEQYKARNNVKVKERYHNNSEYRESERTHRKERYQTDPEFREYYMVRNKTRYHNELNSAGKPKHIIRSQSQRILFDKRKHSRLNGYEIHHCFGYDDPSKFIYIPKVLHTKIHQFLRDNNIDADSNHYKYIANMINECTEYTYISA